MRGGGSNRRLSYTLDAGKSRKRARAKYELPRKRFGNHPCVPNSVDLFSRNDTRSFRQTRVTLISRAATARTYPVPGHPGFQRVTIDPRSRHGAGRMLPVSGGNGASQSSSTAWPSPVLSHQPVPLSCPLSPSWSGSRRRSTAVLHK